MSREADERGRARGLFRNAVQSIQLGIEDYQANNPERAVSAVRNFEPPRVYRRVKHSKDEPYDKESTYPRLSGRTA